MSKRKPNNIRQSDWDAAFAASAPRTEVTEISARSITVWDSGVTLLPIEMMRPPLFICLSAACVVTKTPFSKAALLTVVTGWDYLRVGLKHMD